MQEETSLNKKLTEKDEVVKLKHFIYLDKTKLHSYYSQLLGGVVQLKRLTENQGIKYGHASDEEYREKVQEDGKEAEVSLGPKNYAGGMSGKTTNKTIERSGYKKGVNTQSDEYLNSTTEDIVEHDYGYFKFEEILTTKGILKEINSIEELKKDSLLIKTTGICRFMDWDSIMKVFSSDNVINFFSPDFKEAVSKDFEKNSQNYKNQDEVNVFKVALEVVKAFSIGSVTVNTNIGNSNLIGTINQEHLRITRDQLRSAYIMPGDVEMTIVGFIPRRRIEKITFPGILGTIDMTDLWKILVGEIDAVIEPLAIYTEIK